MSSRRVFAGVLTAFYTLCVASLGVSAVAVFYVVLAACVVPLGLYFERDGLPNMSGTWSEPIIIGAQLALGVTLVLSVLSVI